MLGEWLGVDLLFGSVLLLAFVDTPFPFCARVARVFRCDPEPDASVAVSGDALASVAEAKV